MTSMSLYSYEPEEAHGPIRDTWLERQGITLEQQLAQAQELLCSGCLAGYHEEHPQSPCDCPCHGSLA